MDLVLILESGWSVGIPKMGAAEPCKKGKRSFNISMCTLPLTLRHTLKLCK